MKYFYVHMGSYPYWLWDSINSVRKNDESAEIFLCGDKTPTDLDILLDAPCLQFLKLENIITRETRAAINSKLWKNDPNPLWKTSLYRIFIVRDMMMSTNALEFVHFDSDVILFHGFDKVKHCINRDLEGLHITPCNENELVFGYSYCNSFKALHEICEIVLEAMYDNDLLNSLVTNHANEMQILSGIQKIKPDLLKSLETIPSQRNEYVFDPSSYGQYLFGTHSGHKAGWYGDHHWIGKLIGEKQIQVSMNNRYPYANNTKIVNLHIHSKQTRGILN